MISQVTFEQMPGVVWQLTQEVKELRLELNRLNGKQPQISQSRNYVYGINGLARLLNCSHPTAQRIKNRLPTSTYTQSGRKIVFDADAVLTAINKKGGNQK